jgi:hypothetical protein
MPHYHVSLWPAQCVTAAAVGSIDTHDGSIYECPLPAISRLKREALQHRQVISVGKGARYLPKVHNCS